MKLNTAPNQNSQKPKDLNKVNPLKKLGQIFAVAACSVIAASPIVICIGERNSLHPEEICIKSKTREIDVNGLPSYKIETDKGNYQDDTSIFLGKFKSDELQDGLVEGQRYSTLVTDDTLFSQKNIIEIRKNLGACLDQ